MKERWSDDSQQNFDEVEPPFIVEDRQGQENVAGD